MVGKMGLELTSANIVGHHIDPCVSRSSNTTAPLAWPLRAEVFALALGFSLGGTTMVVFLWISVLSTRDYVCIWRIGNRSDQKIVIPPYDPNLNPNREV